LNRSRRRKLADRIKIVSCVGQDSHHTHTLKPMSNLHRYVINKLILEQSIIDPQIIDPFARTCLWGTHRNDINPSFGDYTTHCMDALEFMCSMATGEAHMVILDPPFSNRQSDEEYGTSNLYANPAYMRDIGLQCFRVLKPGGYVLKAGYNTNAPYKGFTLVAVRIANMGASRNDILFSLWVKTQSTLTDLITV